MHPLIFGSVPIYFVMWACAALTGVAVGSAIAARDGFPAGRAAIAITLLAASILAGSKLLYLAEAQWFPFDDYVPHEVRGSLHGFRIPGGIVAFALAVPVIGSVLRLDWRRFGDAVVPLVAVALVFIRLGCFLNGCCFGKLSLLPWAVAFPRGSWVFWYHQAHGWVPIDAAWSLPVHPLQLYFLVAALLTLAILVGQRQRSPRPGYLQLLFCVLFFGSTAMLEPLRQNYLTLNNWLAPVAAVVSLGLLVRRLRAREAASCLPHVPVRAGAQRVVQ